MKVRALNKTLIYIPVVFWALISVGPLLYVFFLSFQSKSQWSMFPPSFLPKPFTLENYTFNFTNAPVGMFFVNSCIVSLASLALSLFFGSMAAYALGRLKVRGRQAVFLAILSTRMIPGLLTIIPIYVIMSSLGLLNSLWAMIISYTAAGLPMVVFVMKPFFEGLSAEIEEAAKMDGASRWRIFISVLLPLVRPGLAAAAIFVFVRTWNEFMIALTLTNSDNVRTMPVGLQQAIGQRMGEYGHMAAFSMLTILPILLMFIIFQRQFVSGLTQGSSK